MPTGDLRVRFWWTAFSVLVPLGADLVSLDQVRGSISDSLYVARGS